MIVKSSKDLVWYEFELLANRQDIKHAVFTRKGGVSHSPFNTLNTSISADGEVKEHALQNREIIKKHLSVETLVVASQKHTTHIEHYPYLTESLYQACDALITDHKNVALMIQHADCQAAIFFDPVKKCIANVHCGWRGNVQNIYSKVIEKLKVAFDSNPEDILVCISPSLGPSKSEFIHMKEEFPEIYWKHSHMPNHLNLWELSREQLLSEGVLEKNIEIASICTFENQEHFFSYRRNKNTGRNATVVTLC